MLDNFVNFVGREINPAVVRAFMDSSKYEDADFFGVDGSTGNYTKAGYMLGVLGNMMAEEGGHEGSIDVVEAVLAVAIDGVSNTDLLGRDGDCAYAQAAFSNLGANEDVFSMMFDASSTPKEPLFSTMLESGLLLKLIERNEAAPMAPILEEFTDARDYSSRSTEEVVSKFLSEVSYGILKVSEIKVSGGDYADMLAKVVSMAGIVGGRSYDLLFGRNPVTSGSGSGVTNDISRIINGVSHNVFEEAFVTQGILKGLLNPKSSVVSNISVGYGGIPEGIARNSVSFSAASYAVGVEKQNQGYSPLMYYIAKYTNSCRTELLDALREHFSGIAISIDDSGSSEGFNPVGLAAYHSKLQNGGFSGALADFVKAELKDCGSSAMTIWYVSGNVSAFSDGSSNNAFGAVTNIYDKVVGYERTWEEENEDPEASFSDVYSGVVGGILPTALGFDFYQLWKAEFGIT